MSKKGIQKQKYIYVNRDQCIYCSDFPHCNYKLYSGKPADCPREEQTSKHIE